VTTSTRPPQTDAEVDQRNLFQRLQGVQGMQILVLLFIAVIIFTVLAPGSFLTGSNIRSIVLNTAVLCVLGVGMTFVIITAGIDLSIGAVLVFSGVVASKTMTALGGQGWGVATVGILTAVIAGTCWGLINGLLVAKAKVPPLIVTLGTLGASLGLALIISGGVDSRDVPEVLANSIGYGNVFGNIPILVVIAAVIVLIGIILLNHTRFGLYTFAVGSNEQACRRVGIPVDRQLIMVYALMGLLSGIAGILSLSYFQSTTLSGQSTTSLNVIAGVVIGGTSLFGGIGSIFGTVVGLFVPTILSNGFVIIGVQPFWQQVVVGVVLIAAVYVDQRRRAEAQRGGTRPKRFNKVLSLSKSMRMGVEE
jgi:ribose transport system permease protein